MISSEKSQLLYIYDKPIQWNVSCFGNEYQTSYLDIMLKICQEQGIGIPITSIHGSYSCKYNGGRTAPFKETRPNIEYKIRKYNELGIGVKLTFSNMNIHKDTLLEEEMKWYLKVLSKNKDVSNGIICVNDDFAEALKNDYPHLDVIASHVKAEMETDFGLTDTADYYNSKFNLYDIVVVNTYRAFDDDFLKQIKYPDRIEFIVNRSCSVNCKFSKYHHELIDRIQQIKVKDNNDPRKFEIDREFIETMKDMDKLLEKCREVKRNNSIETISKQLLNREEINYLAREYNVTKFKIEGRDFIDHQFITNLRKYIFNENSCFEFIHNRSKADTELNQRLLADKLQYNFIN